MSRDHRGVSPTSGPLSGTRLEKTTLTGGNVGNKHLETLWLTEAEYQQYYEGE